MSGLPTSTLQSFPPTLNGFVFNSSTGNRSLAASIDGLSCHVVSALFAVSESIISSAASTSAAKTQHFGGHNHPVMIMPPHRRGHIHHSTIVPPSRWGHVHHGTVVPPRRGHNYPVMIMPPMQAARGGMTIPGWLCPRHIFPARGHDHHGMVVPPRHSKHGVHSSCHTGPPRTLMPLPRALKL